MDFIIFILILILGSISAHKFTNRSSYPYKNVIQKLWFFHIFFGFVYYWYSLNNSADSLHYWKVSSNLNSMEFLAFLSKGSGTSFMYVLNYFPANLLGLSYFSGTFLYTYIGFLGMLNFIKIAEIYIPTNSKIGGYKLFPLLFFLPNLHFWSVAIGKDTLLFFCVGLFCYSITDIKKKGLVLILSLVLSYMIRPHITLMLLVSFGLIYIFSSNLRTYQRIFFSGVLLIGSIVILPKVMDYVNIEDANIESFNERFSNQAELLNRDSGSGIDISSYPLPLKMITFLYRPTFIDVGSIPSFLAAFENLLLLILSFKAFQYRPWLSFKRSPFVIQGLFIFLIIGTIAFGSSLGNLGIMIRMRNMFLPGMLIYILWALSYRKEILVKLKAMKSQGTKVLS